MADDIIPEGLFWMDKLRCKNEVVSPERNKSGRAGIFIAQNSGGLLPYTLINFHSPQV